jgi:hypothetical protein
MKGTDLSDLETYVESARKVELMALDLAQRNVEDKIRDSVPHRGIRRGPIGHAKGTSAL